MIQILYFPLFSLKEEPKISNMTSVPILVLNDERILSASITLVPVRLHSRVKVFFKGAFRLNWGFMIPASNNASVARGGYENRQCESGKCKLKACVCVCVFV